jgi:serine/threonine-protein kinase
MEYVDGISLRKYIEQQNGINIQESIYLFGLILKGIKELHSFRDKIIHRDLKPENIILTKDLLSLKIIDFGISSVINVSNGDDSKQVYTNETIMNGTYPYICPDLLKMTRDKTQSEKDKYISEQFDFFSLGVIFYEMLMGEKPFYADDYEKIEVLTLPCKYDIMCMSDINPNIPVSVENIIFRCLASKPDDIKYRYMNVSQIISDLEKVSKNPNKIGDTLIKPKSKRLLQLKGIFNVESQRTKERIYEKS